MKVGLLFIIKFEGVDMIINLIPLRTDEELTVFVEGDTITLNGVELDFGPLPEGATLPQRAVTNDWFAGPVSRINGEINVTIRLPHGPNPSPAVCHPEPIVVTEDGEVSLPV